MRHRFVPFLHAARWTCALVALMYHVRFLLFVDYDDVRAKTGVVKVFYFLTGLGHESFAVFFVLDGILTGLKLRAHAAPSRQAVALFRLLLPGLLLGAVLDTVGVRYFNASGLYTAYPAFSTLTLGVPALLGNVFMLQPFVVPTFGSNGMLYLLSYLFWSHVVLEAGLRASRGAGAVLVAALALLAQPAFLIWAATWLAGIAVVHASTVRVARPSLRLAIAGFAGALLLSRMLGADTHWLPAPFGAWLIDCKYLLVGAGFAVLAWSRYPARATRGPPRTIDAPIGDGAAAVFFFHFPVMMLLVGAAETLLGLPLMQQPAPARYGVFAIVVGACVGAMACVTRTVALATAVARGRRPGAII
jgi:hypothetical protein